MSAGIVTHGTKLEIIEIYYIYLVIMEQQAFAVINFEYISLVNRRRFLSQHLETGNNFFEISNLRGFASTVQSRHTLTNPLYHDRDRMPYTNLHSHLQTFIGFVD